MTRVEVTLDGGENWLLCALDHPEKPTKYGRYWCWCFWSIDVELADLLACKEIAVRAWDQSLNTQPEFLTWNLMVRTYYYTAGSLCVHVHVDVLCVHHRNGVITRAFAGNDDQLLVQGEG